MVPTILNRLTPLPEEVIAAYELDSMKRLIVGAAPFPIEVKRRVVDLFPNPCLYEFYGSTETAINWSPWTKYSSVPSAFQRGHIPPSTETCHFPEPEGNGFT